MPSYFEKARVYKPTPYGAGYKPRYTKSMAKSRQARTSAMGAQRGYVRTTGAYNRFVPSGAELKYKDTSVTSTSLTQAGAILSSSLLDVEMGTAGDQRIGRKLTAKSLEVRGAIRKTAAGTAADADGYARLIIYQDKQCNGTAAAVTDILQTGHVEAPYNLNNVGRFKILLDQNYECNAYGAGVLARVVPFKKAFKMSMPVEYSGTTGAITELRSNNIGVLAICDQADTTTKAEFTARVRYSD